MIMTPSAKTSPHLSTYSYNTAVLINNKTWVFFEAGISKVDSRINYMVNNLTFFTQEGGNGSRLEH